MVEKPKIQYVREFYTYGSEAKKLDIQRFRLPRTTLPEERLYKPENIVLDPVAIVGIVAALVLLMVMAFGVVEIQDDWAEYRATENYISSLNVKNSQLKLQYQQGYDLEEVKSKALGLGLVPVEEAKTMTINVTVPEPRHEETLKERILWFWNGLWE